MLIGFGISKPENVKEFIPYCDGVIVGSRIIKSFFDKDKLPDTLQIVSKLNEACRF
jgi:tryptophan synthase alpha chain